MGTQVLSLIDPNINCRGMEFIYYAQTKTVRQQYLRMQKKNLKTFKIIQDNVLQYYQLMKYFMPQSFRGNNKPQRTDSRNNRGGRGSNMRSSGGQFQRGGRGGGFHQGH